MVRAPAFTVRTRSFASITLLLALASCGDSGDAAAGSTTAASTTVTTGAGGEGGGDVTSSSTSSATTGAGGGGGGSVTPVTPGAPGTDLVNAGTVMTSPGYRMIVTIGQSSPAQHEQSSPNHSVKGGLIGATQ